MSAIVIDGAVVHYETWGRGPPLLLVHGWLGSWRYWMRTMEALATDYRTYALDLWGFGDSAKDRGHYNVIGYVRLLHDFMEQMGMGSASFVGHSFGGAIALILASRRPEMVQRLVSVCVPIQASAINGRLRSLSNTLASQLLWHQDTSWVKRLLGLGRITHDEVANEAPKADPEAISESMRSLASINLPEELKRVRSPQLVIFGKNDPLVDCEQTALFQSAWAVTRSIVMEQSGHFPMLEEGPQFHRLLRDFLVDAEDPLQLQVKEMWHRRTR